MIENQAKITQITINSGDPWKQNLIKESLLMHPSVSPEVVFNVIQDLNFDEPAADKKHTADVIAGEKNRQALEYLGENYDSETHAVANGDVVFRIIDDKGETHFFDKVKSEKELFLRLDLLRDLLVDDGTSTVDTMLLSWQVALVVQNGLTYTYDQEIFAQMPKLSQDKFEDLVVEAAVSGLLFGANSTLPFIELVAQMLQETEDVALFITSNFVATQALSHFEPDQAQELEQAVVANVPFALRMDQGFEQSAAA